MSCVADMPVFCGVGGGFTSGARSVAQAMEAEHCGAYGTKPADDVPPPDDETSAVDIEWFNTEFFNVGSTG